MGYTTRILPKEWNLCLVKGDRVPPVSFNVNYYDGVPCTDYAPSLKVLKEINKAALDTLDESAGLIKNGTTTTLNLTTSLNEALYTHYVQVVTNGWTFTVASGDFNVILPGRRTGTTAGLEQLTFTLPIVQDTQTGEVFLVDENGNRLMDSNDNFLQQ